MVSARRTRIQLIYNGADISRDIAPFLLNITYTDNSHGKADDLQVTLQDREGNWRDPWFPEKGATLQAVIEKINWNGDGPREILPCGRFEIDEITCKGPPTTVEIKAVSVPISAPIRQHTLSKAWQEVKLSEVAREIAEKHKLELVWDSRSDPPWDRRDQIQIADLAILRAECERMGLAVKVTDVKLVIFGEEEYEERDPVCRIEFGDKRTLKSYSFRSKSASVYKGAKLQYHDPIQDETFPVYVSADDPPANSQTLNINERVKNVGEARDVAKNRLFQANKREVTGSLSMPGNMAMVGGSMIELVGFGKFSGKYFIEKATHKYAKSGGYETDVEIRRGGPKANKKTAPATDGGFDVYAGEEEDDE